MWNDPEQMLASARERQREIAREVAGFRTKQHCTTELAEVVKTWMLALRTTYDYVRDLRVV